MVTNRATILEWPQIEALKADYESRYPKYAWETESSDACTWYVVQDKEKVLGCCSYSDMPNGVRWVVDFYVKTGLDKRTSVCVALMMRNVMYMIADNDQRPLAFLCKWENGGNIRSVFKRSGAVPMNVLFFRPVGGVDVQLIKSGSGSGQEQREPARGGGE